MLRPDPSLALAGALAAALAASPALAGGVTEQTLYTFGAHSNDADSPSTQLVRDAEGNLFGGSVFGGTDGKGTIFEVSPSKTAKGGWTERVIHSFAGGTDGSDPTSGLALDAQGNLYGTTFNPGTAGGSVFELVRPTSGTKWTKKVLHQFTSGQGSNPEGLLMDKSGALYGVTFEGGGVWRLAPKAAPATGYAFTLLHTFDSFTEGGAPYAGVVEDVAGNLYGTTSNFGTLPGGGGGGGSGTVYRLNRPASAKSTWTLTVLHTFSGKPDGSGPAAPLLIDSAGNLYGTTAGGGTSGDGTVFEISAPTSAGGPWGYNVILNFNGPNGNGPSNSGLTPDSLGNLWGTTSGGGASNAWGAVFELSPSGGGWTPSVPFSFAGTATGAFPGHGLAIDSKGNLYGTTLSNVFEVTP